MLTCSPARVQRGNFDARKREIGNGSYAGIENACLKEAEDAIEAVYSSTGDDIRKRDVFMCIDLAVHRLVWTICPNQQTYHRKEYTETDHVYGKEKIVGFTPPERS